MHHCIPKCVKLHIDITLSICMFGVAQDCTLNVCTYVESSFDRYFKITTAPNGTAKYGKLDILFIYFLS